MLVTDVSGISSEGGTLDMGTKSTLQLYLDSRMGICEEHMGMRACLPLHLHPKRVCVRARTHRHRLPFRTDSTVRTGSPPCSGGATLFPRAPLPARAAPLLCRFVPGTRLHARPLHLQGTLPATSGLGVPSFQVSVTAISPPQGPLGFLGPGARLTGSP